MALFPRPHRSSKITPVLLGSGHENLPDLCLVLDSSLCPIRRTRIHGRRSPDVLHIDSPIFRRGSQFGRTPGLPDRRKRTRRVVRLARRQISTSFGRRTHRRIVGGQQRRITGAANISCWTWQSQHEPKRALGSLNRRQRSPSGKLTASISPRQYGNF